MVHSHCRGIHASSRAGAGRRQGPASSKNFDSGAFSSVNAETLDSGHSRRP